MRLQVVLPISSIVQYVFLPLLLLFPLFYFSLSAGLELYFFVALISIPSIIIFIYRPKIWVYFSILFLGAMLILVDEGVSPIEIAFGISVVGGLLLYFYNSVLVQKRRLVEHTADLLILMFFFFIPFNALFAYLNNVDLLYWIRGVSILSLLLMYFPMREFIRTSKDLAILLFLSLLVVLACSIFVVVQYKSGIIEVAQYAWELASSKTKFNHIVFSCAFIFSTIFFVYSKGLWLKILMIATGLLSAGALVINVSRTFWLSTLLCSILLFLYIGWKKRLQYLFYFGIIFSLSLAILYSVFGSNSTVVLKLMEYRLVSSAKGVEDKSFSARVAEYPVLFEGIRDNPMTGIGIGSKIQFRDPLSVTNWKALVIHNGFLSILYRIGIPLALLYVLFFVFYFVFSVKLLLKVRGQPFEPFVLFSIMVFIVAFVAQTTLEYYLLRDFNFVVVIAIVIVDFVLRNYNEKTVLQ
ncbi:MAG: O-antigen ligase family protein [Ignavibacteria bacterium]|nr:O-antigen ligase family protein [Ignavibacteria bacterium]